MSLTASCSNIFLATGAGFSYRPATFPREQRTGASAIGSAQVCRRWSGGLPVPVMSFPTPRKGGTSMARRFTRAVRRAEIVGAVVATVVLAILFLPKLAGGGAAATPVIEEPDLNVAVVPAVDSAGFFVALHQGLFAAR